MGYNVLDLFCGAGGMSTGFDRAGFNVLLGIDFDKNAGNTYKSNHKNTNFIHGDINAITTTDILNEMSVSEEQIDCIIGGPPCQGFSSAGKRMIQDERNSLYKNFVRIVGDILPKVFLMENVKGLTTMKSKAMPNRVLSKIQNKQIDDAVLTTLREYEYSDKLIHKIINLDIDESTLEALGRGRIHQQIIEDFEDVGYTVFSKLIDCSDFGVPQKRNRVFFLGVRKDLNIIPTFPLVTHSEKDKTTILECIGNLSSLKSNIKTAPFTPYQLLMEDVISMEDYFSYYSHDEIKQQVMKKILNYPCEGVHVSEHDLRYFSETTLSKMMEHKERHIVKKTGFGMRFFEMNRVGYTLTSHFQSNYEMLYPDRERPRYFTIREGARIQGFPDSYEFIGSNNSKSKQIGNSVPVFVAYVFAKHIERLLKGENTIDDRIC